MFLIKNKIRLLIASVGLILVFSFSGCLKERPLPTDELISIYNSEMEKTNKLKPLDTMYVKVAGLKPNAKHEIRILDSDRNLITLTQAYSNNDGVIEAIPVWYDVGLKKPDENHDKFYIDSGLGMKTFYINVRDCYDNGKDTNFEQPFFYILSLNDEEKIVEDKKTQKKVDISKYLKPKIYAATSDGEIENAFEEKNSKLMDGSKSPLTTVYLKVDSLPEKIYGTDENVTDIDIYIIPFDKDSNATKELEKYAIVKVTKNKDDLLNKVVKIWDINITNPNDYNNSYSIVLDIDRDGKYTKGVDIDGDGVTDAYIDGIDGLYNAGFIVKNTPANDPLPVKITDSMGNEIRSIPEKNSNINTKLYLSIENIAISDDNDSVEVKIVCDENGSIVKTTDISIKKPDATDEARYLKYVDKEFIFETKKDFTDDINKPIKLNIIVEALDINKTITVYPVDQETKTYRSADSSEANTLFDETGTLNGYTKIYVEFGKVGYDIGSVYLFDGNVSIENNMSLNNAVLRKYDINVTNGHRELVFDLNKAGETIINPKANNGLFKLVVDYDNNGVYKEDNDTVINITIRDTLANDLPNVGYINIASNGYFSFDNHNKDSNNTLDYGYIDQFVVDGSNTRGGSIRAIWNPYLKHKARGGFYANYWSRGSGKNSVYIDENGQKKASPFNFGQQLDLYIIDADKYPLRKNMVLTGKDLRGAPQTLTTQYSCSNGALMQSILNKNQMKIGNYYVVLDINRDGKLTEGVDYVDAVTQRGKHITQEDPDVVGFKIVDKLENKSITWVRQAGTYSKDYTHKVAVDSEGNVITAGYTYGSFNGQTNQGSYDAFLIKYDKNGNKQWIKQFGTSGSDGIFAIVTKGTDIYVAGFTSGEFSNNDNNGSYDAFIAKFDKDGNKKWIKEFGTSSYDFALAITIDDYNNIYVAGITYGTFDGENRKGSYDGFVAKFNSSGVKQWIKQFGTSRSEYLRAIGIDSSNNIYVAGYTYGSFDNSNNYYWNSDGFIAKFDSSGVNQWIKQFGTSSSDYIKSLAIDINDNIYIVGYTYGSFDGQSNNGSYDGMLVKYDSSGTKIFEKLIGTSARDKFDDIVIDSNNNIYISGYTYGLINRFGNKFGRYDGIIVKTDTNGNKIWAKQFGTSRSDYTRGIATDGNDVYITGMTYGEFDNFNNKGWVDNFVIKVNLNYEK